MDSLLRETVIKPGPTHPALRVQPSCRAGTQVITQLDFNKWHVTKWYKGEKSRYALAVER